jgi:hypothetical protein
MAKDYANYQSKKLSRRNNKGKWKKKWAILFIVILLISVWFGLNKVYKSKSIKPIFINEIEKHSTKVVNAVVKPTAVATIESMDEPQFDFYTILPKERVIIQQQATSKKTDIK